MNFRLLLDIDVVEFMATLPRREQVALRPRLGEIQSFPTRFSDFQEQDSLTGLRLMSMSTAASPFTIGKTSPARTSKCFPSAVPMREGTNREAFTRCRTGSRQSRPFTAKLSFPAQTRRCEFLNFAKRVIPVLVPKLRTWARTLAGEILFPRFGVGEFARVFSCWPCRPAACHEAQLPRSRLATDPASA